MICNIFIKLHRFGYISLCCMGLTGCLYYGDIHGNSHPYNANTLSVHHVYEIPPSTPVSSLGWWAKFNDPQLTQLIAVAISDSPTMQIAESRIRLAEQVIKQAQSALWPSIDLSGYVQRQGFPKMGLTPP